MLSSTQAVLAQVWKAWIARPEFFHTKDYNPTHFLLNFVFTMSNFRRHLWQICNHLTSHLGYHAVTPLTEFSSLDSAPHLAGLFLFGNSVNSRRFLPPVSCLATRESRSPVSPMDSEKKSQFCQISCNAF